jgi:hypothetical protein
MSIYYYDFSKKGRDLLGSKDVPLITNEQSIKESIINLLSTEPGSRPMDPRYGLNLHRYLFEPLDDITADLLAYDIKMGLEAFEPRINNIEVQIEPVEDENTFIIYISFNVKFTSSIEKMEIDFRKIR